MVVLWAGWRVGALVESMVAMMVVERAGRTAARKAYPLVEMLVAMRVSSMAQHWAACWV